MTSGKVYLVGAGPGDPELLTIKGVQCVCEADVIVYDRLVHPSILSHARPDAELIYAGKASGAHTMKQEEINALLVDRAKAGKTVVRLKGGDPFVFGRGGEEAEALADAGIRFEVVPGVTSAVAVPAYAGIPVTHRGLSSTFAIVMGHEAVGGPRPNVRWDKIATGVDTIVLLMGVGNLPTIVEELVKNGRDPATPVALIRWGTTSEQETLVGTLESIVNEVGRTGFKPPAVAVVGEVVRLREKLRWFDTSEARPLLGKRVLVTRSRDQASELSELLRRYGADPVEFPVIKILPPESFAELDSALENISSYDWLLFTSANGVRAVTDRLKALGRDVRWLRGPRIGAIGPKTADAIRSLGVNVDFTPSEFIAEAVVREFPEPVSGKRILIPRAKEAREILPEKLAEQGARVDVVTAYRTEIEESDAARVKELLAAGEIDVITFASSSSVKNFVELVGEGGGVPLPKGVRVACIGPITAKTAEEHGLKPDVVADEYTIEGLAEAIASLSACQNQ